MLFALVVMAGVLLLVAVVNNRRVPWRWESRLSSPALAWPLPVLVVWCVIVFALRWLVGDRYPEGTLLPPPIMFPAIAIATFLLGWFARANRERAWAVITSSMGLVWMYFLTLQ
jgi:hypothetical protein